MHTSLKNITGRIRTLLVLSVVSLFAADFAGAQVLSNGTGGGDWDSAATWSGGSVPTNSQGWIVQAGDTVTAGSGVNHAGIKNSTVLGTLNVNAGASIRVHLLNSSTTTGNGTINLTGGWLTAARLTGSATTTINIEDGGSLSVLDTVAIPDAYTINVGDGGIFTCNAGFYIGARLNLSTGGAFIQAPGKSGSLLGNATVAWSGGTFFANAASFTYSGISLSKLLVSWSSNAANILALSSQPIPQTLTFEKNTGTVSQGMIVFSIYGPTVNDSDRLVQAADTSTTLAQGVRLLVDNANLTGPAGTYVGVSYKLFSTSGTGSYAGINPTVETTVWSIDGIDHIVTWTNTLNTDGTLTVAAVAPLGDAPSAGGAGPYIFNGDVSISGSLSATGSFNPAGSVNVAPGQALIFANDGNPVSITSPGGDRLRFGMGGGAFELRAGGLLFPEGARILDQSAGILLDFGSTLSAVNHLRIDNAAAGQAATLRTAGADATVSLNIAPKGDGNVGIGTATPGEKLEIVGNVKASGTVTAGKVRVPPSGDLSMGEFTAHGFLPVLSN